MTVFASSPKKIVPRTSSWGPSIGKPAGVTGVFQCINTTTAYVAKLEKINKDQNARILQLEEELKATRKAKSVCTEKLLVRIRTLAVLYFFMCVESAETLYYSGVD
eukprot:1114682-Pyramimonas_sp.AAC.1